MPYTLALRTRVGLVNFPGGLIRRVISRHRRDRVVCVGWIQLSPLQGDAPKAQLSSTRRGVTQGEGRGELQDRVRSTEEALGRVGRGARAPVTRPGGEAAAARNGPYVIRSVGERDRQLQPPSPASRGIHRGSDVTAGLTAGTFPFPILLSERIMV